MIELHWRVKEGCREVVFVTRHKEYVNLTEAIRNDKDPPRPLFDSGKTTQRSTHGGVLHACSRSKLTIEQLAEELGL